MRTWILGLLVFAMLTCLLSLPATAEEDGWKLPIWNPFASSKKKPARATIGDSPSDSSWKLPSLPQPKLPSFRSEPARPSPRMASRRRNEPSTWQKLNDGTSAFFGKTKETLMPWTVDKPNKPPTRMASRSQDDEKSSLFGLPSFWSKDKEEPKQPRTVQDFLRQPRP